MTENDTTSFDLILSSVQVGGHCKLIKFNNGSIGKPRIPREAQMYQVRPSKIGPFMPKFKGIYVVSHFDY